MLLYAGPDELVQLLRGQRGEFLYQRIHHRIANGGVPDIVVGPYLIIEASLRIVLSICHWWLYYDCLISSSKTIFEHYTIV